MKYRSIEHTADLGIEVEADTIEQLFEAAALGMFSIVSKLDDVSCENTREIALDSGDFEELMFEWLNELLYLLEAEGLLLSRFDVHSVECFRLEAEVGGEKLDLERHDVLTEVKAATYHDMVVREVNGTWFARVIFDV